MSYIKYEKFIVDSKMYRSWSSIVGSLSITSDRLTVRDVTTRLTTLGWTTVTLSSKCDWGGFIDWINTNEILFTILYIDHLNECLVGFADSKNAIMCKLKFGGE